MENKLVDFSVGEGECVPSAKVDDIAVTIGIGGDVLIIEQPGDNEYPDCVMVYGKEDGKKLLALLNQWIESDYRGVDDEKQ